MGTKDNLPSDVGPTRLAAASRPQSARKLPREKPKEPRADADASGWERAYLKLQVATNTNHLAIAFLLLKSNGWPTPHDGFVRLKLS